MEDAARHGAKKVTKLAAVITVAALIEELVVAERAISKADC